jgi:threonine/homoserine/homoserine lactone efflux protein
VVNFLNPNPYLFWISIGAPLVMKTFHVHLLMAIFFLVCFYVMLVGSKMGVAVIVGKSSAFLKSRQYVYTVRTLGVILVFFGLAFLKDGVKLLTAL